MNIYISVLVLFCFHIFRSGDELLMLNYFPLVGKSDVEVVDMFREEKVGVGLSMVSAENSRWRRHDMDILSSSLAFCIIHR